MAKNYDGWVVKSYFGREPLLVPYSFRTTRTEVIEAWEGGIPGFWKRQRRRGNVECVKVKLEEVE